MGSKIIKIFMTTIIIVSCVVTTKHFYVPEYDPAYSIVHIESNIARASGIIIDESGTILTAGHMFSDPGLSLKKLDPKTMRVTTRNGRSYEIQDVLVSRSADLGICRLVDPNNGVFLPALLSNSDSIQPGDSVMAIGMPLGEKWWYSYGHIAQKPRKGKVSVDIACNPGHSGCAIFNSSNEVVGILVQGNRIGDGMIYCHTSNLAKAFIDYYKELHSGPQ
jgi:S1-C subfamily serine protease